MSAKETFEWLVAEAVKNPSPELQQYIRDSRMNLLSLRSEDERQRFIEEVIGTLRTRLNDR